MAYRIRRRRGADRRFVASAVAAGAILALAAHHGSAPATGSGASAAAMSAPGGGTLSCSGLEALWESAGGSPGTAFMAAEIARAESGGQQYATDDNANGTGPRLLAGQQHPRGPVDVRPGRERPGGGRAQRRRNELEPWVTYQTGAYQGQC